MNADDLTLDIAEPQVLIHFDHDPNNLTEHHRVLLKKLGPGRWIGLTPDHELVILDLNTQRHLVLDRRSRFPPHLDNHIYSFDPLTRNELEGFKRRAHTMSIVLGDTEIEEMVALTWVFSDVGSTRLGQQVPQELLGQLVTLGNRGLLEVDGQVEGVTEIPQSDLSSFKDKAKGELGDLRTIGEHRDSQRRRFLSLSDGLSLVRQSVFDDWGFSGPRATLEFLTSIRESTNDLTGYHFQWLKHSGVNPHSSVVHEHKNLVEILRLGLCRDQLDITNLLSFELATRRLVQLEVAVARSPSSPDFNGLDILLENPVSDGGSAQTKNLDTWVTDRLKERANIQKQARLFREEQSLASKSKGTTVDDQDGGSWRRRKVKPKAKSGAGASSSGAGGQ